MKIARLIFTLETPLHCGGGHDQFLDQPVTRDSAGFYMIPGTSISGALRAEALKLDESEGKKHTDMLFGTSRKDGFSGASLLWCSDAHLLDFDGECALSKFINGKHVDIADFQGPYIRDHVRIDDLTLTASKSGKYDEEIVPVGAKFAVEIKLDGWNTNVPLEAKELFDKVMAKLMSDSIALGGKQTNGYGKIKFESNSQVREFDLCDIDDMKAFINLSSGPRFTDSDKGHRIEHTKYNFSAQHLQGVSGSISIKLSCLGPVMVSGHGDISAIADMTTMTVPKYIYGESSSKVQYEPVIPGSSIKGVLHHRVQSIARLKGMSEDSVERIFGAIKGNHAGVGHVSVSDMLYENSHKEQLVQHVAIDRFTGGALESALFDEAPIWDSNSIFTLRLSVDNLLFKDFGLLAFALLDLAQGELAIGNGTNRGNGRFSVRKGSDSALECLSCNLSFEDKVVNIENGKGNIETALEILTRLDEELA